MSNDSMTTDLDRIITTIKQSDPTFPTRISDIPSFPFTEFDDLQHAVRTGTCTVHRFVFRQEPTVLSLFASKITQYLHTTAVLFAYAAPLLSIVLAVFVSPWWLLGVFGFLFGFKQAKAIYNNAILSAALRSEKAFCFLFYVSQINMYDHTQKREFEWQILKQNA